MKKGIFFAFLLLFCLGLCVVAFADSNDLVIGVDNSYRISNPAIEYLYLSQYPDATITYRLIDPKNDTIDSMKDLDLLILNYTNLPAFDNQQALMDLYDCIDPAIWDSGWMDLRLLCEKDGQLIGFPRSLIQDMWMWNDAVANKYKIEKPDTLWSWDDFAVLTKPMKKAYKKHMYLFAGSDHVSGALSNYMDDPIQNCIQFNDIEDISMQMFSSAFNNFATVTQSRTLCSNEIAQTRDDAQVLFMNLPSGAYYPSSSYVIPPCSDVTNPQYTGQASYYCALNTKPLSESAAAFFHLLTSAEAQCYATGTDNIFTHTPPRYRVTKPSSPMTVTAADLESYQVTDCEAEGTLPDADAYEAFIFHREHAVRIRNYDWLNLSTEMLPVLANALKKGFTEDTYNTIIDLLKTYQK